MWLLQWRAIRRKSKKNNLNIGFTPHTSYGKNPRDRNAAHVAPCVRVSFIIYILDVDRIDIILDELEGFIWDEGNARKT